MRAIAFCLLLVLMGGGTALASATVDQTHITAGESVILQATFDVPPYISDDKIIADIGLTIPPGYHFQSLLLDAQATGWLSSSAGSAQACTGIGCSNDMWQFPALSIIYDTPGTYQLDWQISSRMGEFVAWWLFDTSGLSTAGGQTVTYGPEYLEIGSFSITVDAVPETSTWAMLLIGLGGIAALRRHLQPPGCCHSTPA